MKWKRPKAAKVARAKWLGIVQPPNIPKYEIHLPQNRTKLTCRPSIGPPRPAISVRLLLRPLLVLVLMEGISPAEGQQSDAGRFPQGG
jgi:hypothetical protein